MIVRPSAEKLLLIAQPDHAHAAADVMEYCVPLAARPRREQILHAIAEHDNGWAEVDAAPLVDVATGTVVDFVHAPVPIRHAIWPRGVARLAEEDPWAAALVAQHAITVYDRFRTDREWNTFFAGMEHARDALLDECGQRIDELRSDYVFVRLADLISLTFCAGWTEEQRFGDWTVRLLGARVVVAPDAFGGAAIPFQITAREIPDRPYQSDAELREAFSGASTTTLHGEVVGG